MPELTHSAERQPPPVLASLLPALGEKLSSEQILDRFVSFAAGAGLSLYPAQEEALLELLSGKHLILNTPTGSGKSLVATALHFKAMCERKTSSAARQARMRSSGRPCRRRHRSITASR